MPQTLDGEQAAMKPWFKRLCSWRSKNQTPSTSRHPNAPNAQSTLTTTTTTNVPSTIVSPLPASQAQLSTDHNSPILNKTPGKTIRGASIQASTSTSGSVHLSGETADITEGSPRTDVTASCTSSGKLPSQVEKTLAPCPKFRILLVGNTGVGKSSLIRYVFNIVFNVKLETAIDIADDRVGQAVISDEYSSNENPRFILHDSMGFEPGFIEKSQIVKSFLRDRAEPKAKLPQQVHALWLCIETPRVGSRLLQTGDEDLLKLAKELKIPVIVVFTKYDLLVMEHYRHCSHISSADEKKKEATKRAELAFSVVAKELKKKEVPFVPVSTMENALNDYGGKMLLELTQVTQDNLTQTTQDNLLDVQGTLRALWATAQQLNARQKFELSISEGLKSYWRNLDKSVFFQGHRLVDCIGRIHDDVLKIWNFNDPSTLLSGEEFLRGMLGLVEPLSVEVVRNQRADGIAANGISSEGGDDSSLVLPPLKTIIEMEEFQFLRGKYQKGVSTAIYLAAYIVDLTLVLYGISTVVTANPPKSLSPDFVMNAQDIYKERSLLIHAQVKEIASSFKLEEKIGDLIRGELVSTIKSVT